MSVTLDEHVIAQVDHLAALLGRPRSSSIEEAVAQYVEEQSWQIQAIGDALAAYASGQETLTPHDIVIDGVEARIRAKK